MNTLERMEAEAMRAGHTVGAEVHGRLLAFVILDEGACWILDGEPIHREIARALLDAAGA
ncbi:hypothetical protein [Paraburkholderia terrae]|uniref:hypothetical protein n=1 Tax=Paraburkholderia terrae TaxID=311230 RepID=UPI001EE1568B|nr:hypothetical protein [Paraburkholderia terrae]GJH02268.1 hypothetical protein CBA19C8_16945 [Paraburkholderia terrae]